MIWQRFDTIIVASVDEIWECWKLFWATLKRVPAGQLD